MKIHKPERTCIVCRNKGTKDNFFKVTKNKNGEVLLEKDKKLDGRGAYICKNAECVKLCEKKHALNRVFKQEVNPQIYQELTNELENR